jgi:hypothetical protein
VRALIAIFTAILIPLSIINMLGGVVSGIWLMVIGEWRIFFLGILSIFVATGIISLALIPGLLLAVPFAAAAARGKLILSSILGALAALYTTTVIVVWACAVFYFFSRASNVDNRLPVLLWSYGVAVGPWSYMAQKESQGSENSYAFLQVFFLSIAYIAAALAFWLGDAEQQSCFLIIVGTLSVSFVVQICLVVAIERERRLMGVDWE